MAGSSRARRQPACPCQRVRAVSETVKSPPSRAWEWLGLRLVENGGGAAVVVMISTLADSAMGRSVRTLKPGVVRAMSFDLKLNFINAAKVGENMRATGHVIHAGRRTVVAECRVEGGDGRLVATASATFAVTRDKE